VSANLPNDPLGGVARDEGGGQGGAGGRAGVGIRLVRWEEVEVRGRVVTSVTPLWRDGICGEGVGGAPTRESAGG